MRQRKSGQGGKRENGDMVSGTSGERGFKKGSGQLG